MYENAVKTVKQSLKQDADYIQTGMLLSKDNYLKALQLPNKRNTRITIINNNGEVIYDNEARIADMPNHNDRQEFIEALTNGSGSSKRVSDTLSRETFYYAIRLADGDVLRVAQSADSIYSIFATNIPYFVVIMIIACLVSIFLAKYITKKMLLPLENIDLEHPLENETYDEIAPFLLRIDKQQKTLLDNLQVLQQKQNELNAIMGNMNEGMILLNDKNSIVAINESAAKLLNLGKADGIVGKNIVTVERSKKLLDFLTDIDINDRHETVIKKEDRMYEFRGSSVSGKGKVILIFDVTEKIAAEVLRREFSANVSHELKTPLQSILGYTELIKGGIAKKEDVPRFLEKIHQETEHLIELINNIIKLSQLDEKESTNEFESVNLKKLVIDATQRMKVISDKKELRVQIYGGDVFVNGVKSILTEVIYNLIDNAIKYNINNGSVDIFVKNIGTNAEINIIDTGCGIAATDQERIFERYQHTDSKGQLITD